MSIIDLNQFILHLLILLGIIVRSDRLLSTVVVVPCFIEKLLHSAGLTHHHSLLLLLVELNDIVLLPLGLTHFKCLHDWKLYFVVGTALLVWLSAMISQLFSVHCLKLLIPFPLIYLVYLYKKFLVECSILKLLIILLVVLLVWCSETFSVNNLFIIVIKKLSVGFS
jgi:hypothetical protein